MLLVAGALVVAGCNRGPADEALVAAQQALAAAPEVESDAPEEFAALTRDLQDARASLAAGHYTDALRAAQALPDRIAAARDHAAKRKAERAAAWDTLSRDVPARLDALAARLALLVSGGWISSERQTAAQAEITALGQTWSEATAAAERDLSKALRTGEDVKARAGVLGGSLGIKPTPSANPTAPRTAIPTATPTATPTAAPPR
jgi:hypothetical protein